MNALRSVAGRSKPTNVLGGVIARKRIGNEMEVKVCISRPRKSCGNVNKIRASLMGVVTRRVANYRSYWNVTHSFTG